MSSLTCTQWTYQSSNPDNTTQTGDCTSKGTGCKNPTTDGEKCICDDTKHYTADTDGSCKCADKYESVTGGSGGPTCECAVGYGSANQDGSDCAACTGNSYKGSAGNTQCISVTDKNVVCSPAEGKTEGNIICECKAGFGGDATDTSKPCTECKDNKYKANPGNAECVECTGGNYTAPANGSEASITNKTGPNTQCLAASSSASPLAILLICALIVSIVASVATAAVVIRRKAAAARTAEALVSDALSVSR